MGMESFNAIPVEESERIDDVEKAEVMAHTSDIHRSSAAEKRSEADGSQAIPESEIRRNAIVNGMDMESSNNDLKNISGELAKNSDKFAEEDEAKAAREYDYDKSRKVE